MKSKQIKLYYKPVNQLSQIFNKNVINSNIIYLNNNYNINFLLYFVNISLNQVKPLLDIRSSKRAGRQLFVVFPLIEARSFHLIKFWFLKGVSLRKGPYPIANELIDIQNGTGYTVSKYKIHINLVLKARSNLNYRW